MFAVIKTGGKQYKVASGDIISVERLLGEPGSVIDLEEVLMISDGAELKVGKPFLAGAAVSATVVEQTRGEKIIVFKKKRRQNYRRRRGHRQELTVLKITDIYQAGAPRKAKPAVHAKPKAEPHAKPPHKEAAHKEAAHKEAPHLGAPKAPKKEAAHKHAAKPAAKKDAGKSKSGKRKEKK
jgi:large subunit ribosomal protein L21